MKKILILSLVLSSIATSCQKHLDRADAKRMIVENKNYPIKQSHEITKGYIKDMNSQGRGVTIVLGEDDTKREEKAIAQFESMGLLKLKETPQREETTIFLLGTTVRTWTSVNVELTQMGRKYLINEDAKSYSVCLWETDVKEISGVQERPEIKAAQVEYILFNTNITPFGSIFSNPRNEQNRTANFSLYDDGWRIQ
jgi:hypothetical protein